MEKWKRFGLEINNVSLKELLLHPVMLWGYLFLSIGIFGIYEVFHERYFLLSAHAFDAGLHPGSREVAEAMREAIFGAGGEVKREAPWTLYIANYMYMIYTGSGIIFLVALAELFGVEIIKKTAAGFMMFGLGIVFAGLFTIAVDLNILHMQWMFLSPNFGAGMWLMLPLYSIYIPFVLFEIYLLLTHNTAWAKKIAVGILVLSVAIDIVEYYIQAKLFNMNTARHLWTSYPNLTLYFILSAFVAASGMMIVYAYWTYRKTLQEAFDTLIDFLKKIATASILLLGAYEAMAFLFVDKKWAGVMLFGEFRTAFYLYVAVAMVVPFALLSCKRFRGAARTTVTLIAAVMILVGTYLGRYLFVYGGNAYPMSDRFGTGFEKYSEYESIKEVIYYAPSLAEICVAVGSIGVILLVYKIVDAYLSVSSISTH